MAGKEATSELKNPRYEVFILLLSLLSILNLFILILPSVDKVVEDFVEIIVFFTTLFFLVDFIFRFFSADSKRDYLIRQRGWYMVDLCLHHYRRLWRSRPRHPLGRSMEILILIVGVSTFGAFTGYITNAFLSGRMEESDNGKSSDKTGMISELRSLLEEQARLNLGLSKKLDQMDHSNET